MLQLCNTKKRHLFKSGYETKITIFFLITYMFSNVNYFKIKSQHQNFWLLTLEPLNTLSVFLKWCDPFLQNEFTEQNQFMFNSTIGLLRV